MNRQLILSCALRRPTAIATGMKWLADKADCVTIRCAEGYCRD
jgi:hypothetical protein